jgi:Phage portal protein, SPP1 Gp6-like
MHALMGGAILSIRACSYSDKDSPTMALTPAETAMFYSLSNAMVTTELGDARNDAYYQGTQRLEHIGLAVPPELRRFETVVNWPRLAVDAVEERLDVEGFRLPAADAADDELWRVWQANNLDEESQLAHLDALIYGRAFVCVGTNGDDPNTPLVTVESPRQMVASIDDRTRVVNAALRMYGTGDTHYPVNSAGWAAPTYATLYLPDATIFLAKDMDGRWVDYNRDPHNFGVVPVVPLINRRRTGLWSGVSDLADIIPLTDAAARSLTNLQIASETHSVPQKWVLGMSKGDFVNADGTPVPAWQSYFSAIWANQNADATVGQFTASSLSNFHDTVDHYAKLVAALTGLPPHYLGISTANPASADAIRSSESRLVKRAERKQRVFGGAWEQTMRLCQMFIGADTSGFGGLETVWRDASTPTEAAKADAAVKLKSQGILSREGVWEYLGWSEPRRQRERDYFDAEANTSDLAVATRALTVPVPAPVAPPTPPAPVGPVGTP